MYVKTTDTSTGTKRGVYMAAQPAEQYRLLGSIVEHEQALEARGFNWLKPTENKFDPRSALEWSTY